jgi:hypothetical protein
MPEDSLAFADRLIQRITQRFETISSASTRQRAYTIEDPHEAKIFFDLLVIYGFVAKFYRETNHSKVYVSPPKINRPISDALLDDASSFARAAISIKTQLDHMVSDHTIADGNYSLTLSKTANHNHQITILLASEPVMLESDPSTASPPPATAISSASNEISTAASATQKTAAYSRRSQNTADDIFTVPAVLKPTNARREKLIKASEGNDNLWRRTKLYIKGNAFYSMLVFIGCVLALVVFISFLVASKAFLCPDFASMKDDNPPWYCKSKSDEKK